MGNHKEIGRRLPVRLGLSRRGGRPAAGGRVRGQARRCCPAEARRRGVADEPSGTPRRPSYRAASRRASALSPLVAEVDVRPRGRGRVEPPTGRRRRGTESRVPDGGAGCRNPESRPGVPTADDNELPRRRGLRAYGGAGRWWCDCARRWSPRLHCPRAPLPRCRHGAQVLPKVLKYKKSQRNEPKALKPVAVIVRCSLTAYKKSDIRFVQSDNNLYSGCGATRCD
ncbi:uncharacterized protein LOC102716666 [Oryza brachyantha]|uniref:uncharacterized protein LOC102716666 n=1 Tax=Oryza brachyantha TaxID=4533 RepID=UPI001ADA96E2|nr:uncharacterized protein LOC102716666 [Oryza brachyantha]